MELIVVVLVPVLFLMLAAGMIVVSQVSGFLTFVRYHSRQSASNRVIADFIGKMAAAQGQLARRSRELGALTQRMALSNQELERLNSMKSKFLSMAVHDVRTPLGTIRGYAELLSDRAINPKENEWIKGILLAGDQVNRLVGDLTDLAVIEAGKLRMERRPFEVSSLILETASTYSMLARKKGVQLSVREAPTGSVFVGDRFRLGQVLGNLIGNALKFTPEGGRIDVSVRNVVGGLLWVVSDTGRGIDPAERRRIFEKFYQSRHNEAAEGRKGWGLGLSIAQEIVRAHNGEIGVESAGLGRGSKFWFFTPVDIEARRRAPRYLLPLLGALLALFAGSGAARAQGIPLDDKARYDRFLEEKAEGVLLKILGPNRAKVVVDAALDFTRTERFEIATGGAKSSGSAYAWQSVTAQPTGRELLPGVPMEQGDAIPQKYERQYAYPASFIKRLTVNIILDKSVSVEQGDSIRTIVSDLLEITPDRGDALTVVRANFAPVWKTAWYSQDSFSMLFKYALLSFMMLVALAVIAACFLKLAAAMDSMAKSQAQQYAMDLNIGGAGQPAEPLELGARPALAGPAPSRELALSEREQEEERLKIEVEPEQVGALVEMLKGQDADNVALVATYLGPSVRRTFLHELPRDIALEVLRRMSSVRFVEPELLEKIKAEIEHRLAGAIGGLSRVQDILESSPAAVQRQMLSELQAKDPQLYKLIRARVLLIDDLIKLNQQEWLLLMGQTQIADWAAALKTAPEKFQQAIQSQVLPKTWTMLKQVMETSSVAAERAAEAQAVILAEARRLMMEGRIRNLLAEAS